MAKQKSRINWIREGDQNTKFFHQSVKARVNHNKILSLENNGTIIHDVDLIHHEAVSYFQCLFTEPVPAPALEDLQFIHKSISQIQADDLIRYVTPEEIKAQIFRMEADKSPGPDGFNAGFFQKL